MIEVDSHAEMLFVDGPAKGRTYVAARLPSAWMVEEMTDQGALEGDRISPRRGFYCPISDLSRSGYNVLPLRSRDGEWLMMWDGWR